MSTFNSRVRNLLNQRGLTIKDLADRIGMHREALSKILNNRVDPTFGTAERIAEGLDLQLYELISPEEPAAAAKPVHAA